MAEQLQQQQQQQQQQQHLSKLSHAAQYGGSCPIDALKRHFNYKHVYAMDREFKVLNEGRPLGVSGAQKQKEEEAVTPRLSDYPNAVYLFTYNEATDVIFKNGRGNQIFYDFTARCNTLIASYTSAKKKSTFVENLLEHYTVKKGARYFQYHNKKDYPTFHTHLDKSFVNTICNKFRGIRRAMEARENASTATTAATATATATTTAPYLNVYPVVAAAPERPSNNNTIMDNQPATTFPSPFESDVDLQTTDQNDDISIDLDSFDFDVNMMWEPSDSWLADQGENQGPYCLDSNLYSSDSMMEMDLAEDDGSQQGNPINHQSWSLSPMQYNDNVCAFTDPMSIGI